MATIADRARQWVRMHHVANPFNTPTRERVQQRFGGFQFRPKGFHDPDAYAGLMFEDGSILTYDLNTVGDDA